MKNQTITPEMINTRSARDLETISEIMEDGSKSPAQAMEQIAMIAEMWAKMAEEQRDEIAQENQGKEIGKTEIEVFDGTYAIEVTGDDKHPDAFDNRTKTAHNVWILPVTIRAGYTTLDKETVTRILTIGHDARIENLTPLAAYEVAEDGRIDLNDPVKIF